MFGYFGFILSSALENSSFHQCLVLCFHISCRKLWWSFPHDSLWPLTSFFIKPFHSLLKNQIDVLFRLLLYKDFRLNISWMSLFCYWSNILHKRTLWSSLRFSFIIWRNRIVKIRVIMSAKVWEMEWGLFVRDLMVNCSRVEFRVENGSWFRCEDQDVLRIRILRLEWSRLI
jgi:hypothetical protein